MIKKICFLFVLGFTALCSSLTAIQPKQPASSEESTQVRKIILNEEQEYEETGDGVFYL